MSSVLTAVPVKDVQLDEALAKECLATFLYAEHTLIALARTLPRNTMSEAQETLFPVPATFPCTLGGQVHGERDAPEERPAH
jgi:hypothetical protein